VHLDRITAFFECDDDNMMVTSQYAPAGIPRPLPDGGLFRERLDRKLLFFFSGHNNPMTPDSPLHIIPGNTPSVLIPLLMIGKAARHLSLRRRWLRPMSTAPRSNFFVAMPRST